MRILRDVPVEPESARFKIISVIIFPPGELWVEVTTAEDVYFTSTVNDVY
jgi:hypothetical protein